MAPPVKRAGEGDPSAPSDLVVMAQVKEPYGLKGWIKLYMFGEARDGLKDFSQWWLNRGSEAKPDWQGVIPEQVAEHGGTLVAKWPGVEDRDAAFALKGLQIAVPRSQFAANEKNEFYWSDLIGLAVSNRQGALLGQVEGLLDLGPHQVLRVRPVPGLTALSAAEPGVPAASERLIPFVAQYIDAVDLTAREIKVDWGLDY